MPGLDAILRSYPCPRVDREDQLILKSIHPTTPCRREIDMSIHTLVRNLCRGRRFSVLQVIVFVIILGLCLAGCTEPDSPDAQSDETAATPSGSADSPDAGEAALDGGRLSDRGTPCETHRYVMAPGTSGSLAFEVELSFPAADTAGGELKILVDQWEEIEVSASLGYCRVETADVSHPRWVVDGRDFLNDSRARGKSPASTAVGDALLVWGSDGYGTIASSRIARRDQDLGELSGAEIAELLGGSTTFDYTDPDTNTTYNWFAEQQSVEKTIRVLVIELAVDTPAAAVDTTPRQLKVGVGATGWVLSAQYSDFRDVYVFTGPGQRLDCFE
jgi:hypothetical protein